MVLRFSYVSVQCYSGPARNALMSVTNRAGPYSSQSVTVSSVSLFYASAESRTPSLRNLATARPMRRWTSSGTKLVAKLGSSGANCRHKTPQLVSHAFFATLYTSDFMTRISKLRHCGISRPSRLRERCSLPSFFKAKVWQHRIRACLPARATSNRPFDTTIMSTVFVECC